ncbi:MAG: hypothetical protein XD58_0949 [Thermotoga sp. 50_1627]|nr:MAG: hypothetical protein XD45_0984 [Thermotoga sp. 50_64]KUK25021.1 MAG: hypothetical protein XD58_0949 [Thermotoga sp. 50_1627]
MTVFRFRIPPVPSRERIRLTRSSRTTLSLSLRTCICALMYAPSKFGSSSMILSNLLIHPRPSSRDISLQSFGQTSQKSVGKGLPLISHLFSITTGKLCSHLSTTLLTPRGFLRICLSMIKVSSNRMLSNLPAQPPQQSGSFSL